MRLKRVRDVQFPTLVAALDRITESFNAAAAANEREPLDSAAAPST